MQKSNIIRTIVTCSIKFLEELQLHEKLEHLLNISNVDGYGEK